jgi:hypothetical protein
VSIDFLMCVYDHLPITRHKNCPRTKAVLDLLVFGGACAR